MSEETKDGKSLEDEVIEAEQRNIDDYSIYKIIKEEGNVIFAAGSICVTILAACLRLSSYLKHLAYLRYWNVDTALLSEPSYYWLENVSLSFLLTITATIYTVLISIALSKIAPLKDSTKRQARMNRGLIKSEKKNHKRISKQKSDLVQARNEHSYEYYTSKQTQLNEYLDEITDTQSELLATKKTIKNISMRIKLLSLGIFAIVSILCCGGFTLANLRLFESIEEAVVNAIITMVILFILTSVNVFITRKVEKEQKNSASDSTDQKGVNNSQLVSFVIISLIMCFSYALLEYNAGKSEASKKNTFLCTENEDALYAIIATDSDYMIAEKITIIDDAATVYTDSKYILSKENEPTLKTIVLNAPPLVVR